MSRHGDIVLAFGTEERTFRLGIEQLRAIQEKCDAGPGELLQRLAPPARGVLAKLNFGDMVANGLMGSWRVDDVREVILQGLIGGGESPTMAGILVRAEIDPKFSWALAPVAYMILEAAIREVPDEPGLGEPKAATPRRSRRSRTASSGSPTSTAPGP